MLLSNLKRFFIHILLVVLLVISISLYFFIRESTVEECVLNHSKYLSSDSAPLIYEMCEEKHAKNPQKLNYFDLNQFQLMELTGRAGPTYSGSDVYGINVYNGNKDITISEITVLVTTLSKKREPVSREYKTNVSIASQSTKGFTFRFVVGDAGSTYSWSIASAKGYKSN